MKQRREFLALDLAPAQSPDELLSIVARALGDRGWDDRDRVALARDYHDDWSVFYECVELREDLPKTLRLCGWSIVKSRMPDACERLSECFAEMAVYHPESASTIEYA
jgi:hypothetical protein